MKSYSHLYDRICSFENLLRKYFSSIDHEILLGLIARNIRDKQVLWLIRVILDASNPQEPVPDLLFEGDDPAAALDRRKGLPIGNLTSQFFANLYLNGLDHFLKEELGCRQTLRYMNDLVALDNDKGWLHWVKEEIRLYLAGLRLRPHEKKCRVFPVREGIELLGYRVYPDHRRLRRDNVVAFRRKLKKLQEAYGRGEIDLEKLNQSIRSWIAHASHADTYGLRRRIFEQTVFRKEAIPGAEKRRPLEIEG